MKNSIVVALLFLSLNVIGKEPSYPVSDIPPALKENAYTVMRLQKETLTIISSAEALHEVVVARTILNKNGNDKSLLVLPYSSLFKIKNLKGRIINAQGEQVRKISSDEIGDYSAISNYSLYEDSRVKVIEPKYEIYPFTIEYSYEIAFLETMILPSFDLNEFNTSYQNVEFKIVAPENYTFRYKTYGVIPTVVKSKEKGSDVYSWNLQNILAFKKEPRISGIPTYYPSIKIAPNNFEIASKKGNLETWTKFGNWLSTLLIGKDKLSEATKQKMIAITSNCKSDYEKVKVVYEYMQQKTRYVNISVGMGGWEPFDAETVDRLSYGDCKALSNYTKALLNSVGIKSYYTVIYGGANAAPIDVDFPSSQFNHIVVCVPLAKDTLWLECTSQRLPCGFNGDFTDNRYALLVDDTNSRLVKTRSYHVNENITSRTCNVELTNEFSGVASIKSTFYGIDYDNEMPSYYMDEKDQKKKLIQDIPIPSCSLVDFSYQNNKSVHPSLIENQRLAFDNYVTVAGESHFLNLNFHNKLRSIPDKVRNRKFNFKLNHSWVELDTVNYKLPVEYKISSLPQDIEVVSKFGKYNAKVKSTPTGVTYLRRWEEFEGEFQANEYADYLEFLETIVEKDGVVINLVKK